MADDVKIAFHVDDHELEQTSQKLQHLQQTAQTAGSEGGKGLGGMLSSLSQLGFGIFGAQQALTGFASVAKGLFASNIQFEGFQTAFEVILGSTEAAKARMEELATFAKETPFELPQVVQASKILENFGGAALSTGDGLRLVGDVAAGTGQPIQELALHFGRLYDGLKNGTPVGESMARLQELGAISGATRNKIEELQKTGADGEIVWAQFAEGVGKYSGMMDKQSKTVGGAMSNISDGIGQMKRNIMAGIFEAAKPGIIAFAGWLGSEGVQGAVKKTGEAIGEFVTKGIGALIEGITKVIGFVEKFVKLFLESPLGKWIADHKELVIQLMTVGVVGAVVIHFWDQLKEAAGAAVGIFGKIKDVLGNLFGDAQKALEQFLDGFSPNKSFKGVMTAQTAFTDFGRTVREAIDVAKEAFGTLVDALAPLADAIMSVDMDTFAGAWDKLKEALQPAIDILKPLAEDVLVQLKEAVAPIAAALKDDLLPALVGLQPAGEALLPVLEGIGKILAVVLVAGIAALLIGLKLLVEVLTVGIVAGIKALAVGIELAGAAIEKLSPIVMTVSEFLGTAFDMMLTAGKAAFDGIKEAVETLGPVFEILHGVLDTFMAAWSLAWEVAKTAVKTAFDIVVLTIQTAIGIIKGVIDIFIGLFQGDWDRVWKGLKEVVTAAWEGIKGGVQIGVDLVSDVISNWWPKIKELFNTGIEAIKTLMGAAISFLVTAGEDIVKGLWHGIVNMKDWFMDQITGFFGSIKDKAMDVLKINSPSKVFHEVGVGIVEGLSDGIEAEGPQAVGAIHDLAVDVTDVFKDMTGSSSEILGTWVQVLDTNLKSGHALSNTEIQAMFTDANGMINNSGMPDAMKSQTKLFLDSFAQGFEENGSLSNAALIKFFDGLIATANAKSTQLGSVIAAGAGGAVHPVGGDVPSWVGVDANGNHSVIGTDKTYHDQYVGGGQTIKVADNPSVGDTMSYGSYLDNQGLSHPLHTEEYGNFYNPVKKSWQLGWGNPGDEQSNLGLGTNVYVTVNGSLLTTSGLAASVQQQTGLALI